MKITGKIAAIALLLATSVSAFAESYVRPELLWSSGKLDDVKSNEVGYGIAGGVTLGAQSEHDIGLSLSQTSFTDSSSYEVVYGTARTTGVSEVGIKSVPLMLNYRYVFLGKSARIRPYIGPSIGMLNAKIDLKATAVATSVTTGAVLANSSFNESKSTTVLNLGVTAGVVWNVSDKIAIDLGYRYSQAKIKISEWELDSDLKVSTVALGVSFRF